MNTTRFLGLDLPATGAGRNDAGLINQDLAALTRSNPPSFWDETTDPGVSEDSDRGYYVGARWLNRTIGKVWLLIDDTPGAAVWQDATQASAEAAIDALTFGDGRDGAIRYQSAQWQSKPKGSATWSMMATVSGKWVVGGAVLWLERNFHFEDVTVASGATVKIGLDNGAQFYVVKVSGTCTVDGTIRGLWAAGSANKNGDSKTSAGIGNESTGGFYSQGIGQPGASGSGGGSAAYIGGAGTTHPGARKTGMHQAQT